MVDRGSVGHRRRESSPGDAWRVVEMARQYRASLERLLAFRVQYATHAAALVEWNRRFVARGWSLAEAPKVQAYIGPESHGLAAR